MNYDLKQHLTTSPSKVVADDEGCGFVTTGYVPRAVIMAFRHIQSTTISAVCHAPKRTTCTINMALAAEGAAIAEALRLPRVSDLVHLAIHETDFLGDLCDALHLLEANVQNSIDLAADIWSDAHGFVTVPLSLIVLARSALMAEAQDMLECRAQHAADRLYDAQQAGDVDADGEPLPYARYGAA